VELLAIWVILNYLQFLNDFLAPEVMCRQNHGVAVDYFALGVMAYEFMMGRVNFYSPYFDSYHSKIETLSWKIKKGN